MAGEVAAMVPQHESRPKASSTTWLIQRRREEYPEGGSHQMDADYIPSNVALLFAARSGLPERSGMGHNSVASGQPATSSMECRALLQ